MNIILSNELENIIIKEISKCENDVNIVTAFCKLETLRKIDLHIKPNINKRLLVRFLPSDLLSGATDKTIYEYCKKNGWKIYIDFSIHAKTYIFDKIKCILGSANLTNKGIGISINSNKEISSYFEIEEEDYNKILSLYSDAEQLDDELFNLIVNSVDDHEIVRVKRKVELHKTINCLMPEDFPDDTTDIIELYNLKSYKWLISYLKSKNNKMAYFGELSSMIHDIFIKEPKPYRKDIKIYLSSLLSLIKKYNVNNILVEKPNYSECVKLLEI